MEKVVLILVFVGVLGMVGWTVHDFVDVGDNEESDDCGGIITSEPAQNECGEVNNLADDVGLGKGEEAPDLELKTLDGEKVKIYDYEVEKVIVNFWATWCPRCREEIPDLQKLYDNYDVEILAIDLTETESSLDVVEEFVYDEFEMTFPVLLDETSE